MADQNETRTAPPPTMATEDERHESALTARLRDAIKPLYSKEHRVTMTASSIQSALKRDFEKERREIKQAERQEWDWTLPLLSLEGYPEMKGTRKSGLTSSIRI